NQGRLFIDYLEVYAFYPPLFDLTTALYFIILGPSLFAGRLVSVTFGLLTVWAVFEYAYRNFEPRTALLSSIVFASMPGFIVLCRLALIETMLLFFFTLALMLFFWWVKTNNNKLLLLTGLALGLGFITKYQTLIGGIVMLVTILLMYRDHIIKRIGKLMLIAIIAGLVFLPWFVIVYSYYAAGNLEIWMYAISVGTAERTAYSERFHPAIFYLQEMTYPYNHIHPVSLPLYILGLVGLGYWAWRRKEADKFSLIWFVAIYVIFTLIPNKNWRYVTLLFPILAISASDLILALWDKLRNTIKTHRIGLRNPMVVKLVSVVFIVSVGATMVYSWNDAYSWVEREHVNIPIEDAAQYVHDNSPPEEGLVTLFNGNFFSTEMVRFYLRIKDSSERRVFPYPKDAVDSYPPTLNETQLVELCVGSNVRYLLLYEHGNITYYQSDWKSYYVLDRLLASEHFTQETVFGTYPRRITVLKFTPNP
ncbi:MAG: glycosyltransferase family 39 protein, partial [Candidatus Bathyarchaeota archaeon]|nr:glycosyltransferase family 39 protein [Candidatus Bathyarchaeota archaeon]